MKLNNILTVCCQISNLIFFISCQIFVTNAIQVMYIICGAATVAFENMANLALAVNLITYFNGVMHFNLADGANDLTNLLGTSYILTIIVAFLADTYLGRFKAVLVSTFLEFLVCFTYYWYFSWYFFSSCSCLSYWSLNLTRPNKRSSPLGFMICLMLCCLVI